MEDGGLSLELVRAEELAASHISEVPEFSKSCCHVTLNHFEGSLFALFAYKLKQYWFQ